MKIKSLLIASVVSAALTSCGFSSENNVKSETDAKEDVTEAVTEETPAEAPAANDVVVELQAGEDLPDNGLPTVIDFNATWCGPCKNFAPVFHAVAADYVSKANFVSVDVDVREDLAKEFEVHNIPMIAIVYPKSSGKNPVTSVGQMTDADFRAYLNANL